MRQTTIARLRRLEKIVGGMAGPEMIIWRVIDPGEPDREHDRCKNIGTGQTWDKAPGESAESFERRMVDQARLFPGVPWLVMMPPEPKDG